MTNRRVPVYREIAGEIDASRTPTLDVGCGNNKITGAVGIDLVAGTQADIVHDLNVTPWPLESDRFEIVRLWSVLEHLRDVVSIVGEVYRVSRNGATVIIGVPHFTSVNAYSDPTHAHFFSASFMDYFIEGTELARTFGFYSSARFRMDERRVTLSPFWARLRITRMLNRNLHFYETYLSGLIRGADIQLKLTVLK
jgi:SAM-dependent methyltransferase